MKSILNVLISLVVFSISFNCYATKIAPISFENLLNDSSVAATIKITNAQISTNKYEIVHSGKERFYFKYLAIIIDPIKGKEIESNIKFSSREPLLIGQENFVFLNSPQPEKLIVAQAGFAAFEKKYIFFAEGIKQALRIPQSYITMPTDIERIAGITKINEQSSYSWFEYIQLKNWQIKKLKLTSR